MRKIISLAAAFALVALTSVVVVGDADPAAAIDGCPVNATGSFVQSYNASGGRNGSPGGTDPGAISLRPFGIPNWSWTLVDSSLKIIEYRLVPNNNNPSTIVPNPGERGSFRLPTPPAGDIVFCFEDAGTAAVQLEKFAAGFPDSDGDGIADDPLTGPQTITYILGFRNTGTVPLRNIVITDPNLPGLDCSSVPAELAPGIGTSCTGTRTVTQADIDSLTDILNVATVVADSDVGTATDSDSLDIQVERTPELETSVNSTGFPDTDGDGIADTPLTAPGVIDVTTTVTNTGNVTLTNIQATTLPGPCSPALPATLAPGDTVTCTRDYSVSQADFDTGSSFSVVKTFAGTGAGRDVSDSASFRVPYQKSPAVSIEKTSTNFPPGANPGQADPGVDAPSDIEYRITVRNTGNVTLTAVSAADPDVDSLDCSALPATLAPGATGTCDATTAVDQTEIDAGGDIINTATVSATGAGQDLGASDSYDVPVVQNPSVTLTKTGDSFALTAGGTIDISDGNSDGVADNPLTGPGTATYAYTLANTGNVTVDNLDVNDQVATGAGTSGVTVTCGATSLAPGASTTCSSTYAVTQADIDAGVSVRNVAIATGTSAGGVQVSANDSFQIGISAASQLVVTKSSPTSTLTGPGDIAYTVTVENSGGASVTVNTVDDDLIGPNVNCPALPVTLNSGDSFTCSPTLTVDQATFDAGLPVFGTGPLRPLAANLVVARGTDAGGAPIVGAANNIVTFDQQPGLAFSKVSPSNPDADGDGVADTALTGPGTIDYELVIENTGNVTLDNPSIVDTSLGTLDCDTATSLAPGGTYTCTGSFTVDQAGFDDGVPLLGIGGATPLVANIALAGALPPGATGPGDAAVDGDFFIVPFDQQPGVEIEKTSPSYPDSDGDGIADTPVDAPGTIDYAMTISNTGNVTLTGVSVSDPDATGLSCGTTALAPGATTTCTATGTVTQADIDAGGDILNTATVSATGAGTTVSDSDTFDIPIEQRVAALIEKTSTSHPDDDGDGIADNPIDAPGPVEYVITGTNTGNVDFTGVTITDPLIPDLTCTFPGADGVVPPGGTVTCTGALTADQALIDGGGDVLNVATATGEAIGQTFSDQAAYDIPILQDPGLAITKTPAEQEFSIGRTETVQWRIEVTNTGNLTLSDVQVEDAIVDGDASLTTTALTSCAATIAALGPGESLVLPCSVRREITDVPFANLVGVSGSTPGGLELAVAAGAVVRGVDELPETGMEVGPWFLGAMSLLGAGLLLVRSGRSTT